MASLFSNDTDCYDGDENRMRTANNSVPFIRDMALRNISTPNSDVDVNEIADRLFFTLFPVLLAVGILGNTLTITIMSRYSLTSVGSRYILILLSICDMTMITMHTFNKKSMTRLIGFDIRALSFVGCKTFFYVYRTVKCMSSWLVVGLCVERFIAVVFPLRVKLIITRRRLISIILCLFIFLIAFNAVWAFSIDVVKSKNKAKCKQNVETGDSEIVYDVFLVLYNAIFSWIPICIISSLTPIIIYKLIKQSKKREVIANAVQSGNDAVKISAMLICVVITYTLFILPVTVFHANKSFYNFGLYTNRFQYSVCKEVVQYLEMLNYSINFLMYTFGSATYRGKAKRMFCKGFTRMNSRNNSESQRNTRLSVVKSETSIDLKYENTIDQSPVPPTYFFGHVH